jgi:hypothetical protein
MFIKGDLRNLKNKEIVKMTVVLKDGTEKRWSTTSSRLDDNGNSFRFFIENLRNVFGEENLKEVNLEEGRAFIYF